MRCYVKRKFSKKVIVNKQMTFDTLSFLETFGTIHFIFVSPYSFKFANNLIFLFAMIH